MNPLILSFLIQMNSIDNLTNANQTNQTNYANQTNHANQTKNKTKINRFQNKDFMKNTFKPPISRHARTKD